MSEVFKTSCPKCYNKYGKNDHLEYHEVLQTYSCRVCCYQVED